MTNIIKAVMGGSLFHRRFSRFVLLLGFVSTIVTGCEYSEDWFAEHVNINGSRPIVLSPDGARKVDLVVELSPSGQSPILKNKNNIEIVDCSTSDLSDAHESACLSEALRAFYADPSDQILRRNRLQGSLRKASEQNCGQFFQRLNTMQADSSKN